MKKFKTSLVGLTSLFTFAIAGCNVVPTTKSYTVTFDTNGGNEIDAQTIKEGEKVSKPTDPTKEATAQYTYTFVNWKNGDDVWDFENDTVTGNLTLTANYTETVNQYLVKWVNDDGSELYRTRVNYGETPTYVGDNPVKNPSNTKTYTFAGWDQEAGPITGNTTYTATYTEETRKYTIRFVDYDGTTLESYSLEYGAAVSFAGSNPTRQADGVFTYVFIGWDKEIVNVAGNATYTAQYAKTFSLEGYLGGGREYDLIQDFEATTCSQWHANNITLDVDTEHKIVGNGGLKLSTEEFGGFTISMLLGGQKISNESWATYDKIRLYVYAEKAGVVYFYNLPCVLDAGQNVIELNPAQIVEQITDGDAKSPKCYDTDGWFLMQCEPGVYTLDALIGVYPEGYEKQTLKDTYVPEDRAFDILQDFESESAYTGCASSIELSTEHVAHGDYSLKMTSTGDWTQDKFYLLKNNKRLEEKDWNKYETIKIYIYNESCTKFAILNDVRNLSVGENVIELTPVQMLAQINSNAACYDANGAFWFQGCTGTMFIDAIMGVYPEGFDPTTPDPYFPADPTTYDLLQDFEGSGISWDPTSTQAYVSEHVVSGEKASQATLTAWSYQVVTVVKDGTPFTEETWLQYKTLKLHVHSTAVVDLYILSGAVCSLAVGDNDVEIPVSTILAQIIASKDGDGPKAYDIAGGLYIAVSGATTITMDALLGIKDPNYVPPHEQSDYLPKDPTTYDLLQDFEGNGIPWNGANTVEYVTTDVVSGSKAAKITAGAWSGFTIKVLKDSARIGDDEWEQYSSLRLHVVSSGAATIFILNGAAVDIVEGENTVDIPVSVITAQIEASKDAGIKAYDVEGGMYFQFSAAVTVTIDGLLGIKVEQQPVNTYLPTDSSTYDLLQDFEGNGVIWASSVNYVTDHVVTGQKAAEVALGGWGGFTVRIWKNEARIADDAWEQYSCLRLNIHSTAATTFYILNGAVIDLTEGDNVVDVPVSTIVAQIEASKDGDGIKAYDVEGSMYFQVSAAATLTIDGLLGIKDSNYVPADKMDNYFPADTSSYQMLQDFEDEFGIGYIAGTKTFTKSHRISGNQAVKIETSGVYTIRLTDNGTPFTESTWTKFTKLVFYVYVESSSAFDFYLYNKAYWVTPGQNKIEMDISDVIAQSKGTGPTAYDAEGCFYMQAYGSPVFYLDAIYGVLAAE